MPVPQFDKLDRACEEPPSPPTNECGDEALLRGDTDRFGSHPATSGGAYSDGHETTVVLLRIGEPYLFQVSDSSPACTQLPGNCGGADRWRTPVMSMTTPWQVQECLKRIDLGFIDRAFRQHHDVDTIDFIFSSNNQFVHQVEIQLLRRDEFKEAKRFLFRHMPRSLLMGGNRTLARAGARAAAARSRVSPERLYRLGELVSCAIG